MNVVVDTSVILKWFFAYGEDGLDEAGALLRAHRDESVTLVAPGLAAIEVANVLRYLGIEREDGVAFLDDFAKTRVSLVPGTPARVRRATECAFEHRISVYDAMFLTLAVELDCELATADRRAFGAIAPSVAAIRLIG